MKKNQLLKFTIYLALLFVGLIFNTDAAAQNTTATLTFNGLQNGEEVREFYNGGAGSLGSNGGTNYGITINVPNGFTTQVSF